MEEKIAPREVFGRTLVDLGKSNKNIIVLDADLGPSTRVSYFAEEFPERFIQVGVAEQNMVGMAAGLSTFGFIPFATTFACFISKRACDQVALSVAYPKMNVKLIGAYCGLFSGKNGATHQSLEDIAIMRAIPNMIVLIPADGIETEKVIRFAAQYKGPVYIRIPRDPLPTVNSSDYEFSLGKATILTEGSDASIICAGTMVSESLKAAKELLKEGIKSRVINMSSIKPIDEETIVKVAKDTGAIVTVENHNIIGGLGGAVAEVLGEKFPAPLKRVGVKDAFGKSGENEEMKKKFGLTSSNIEDAVRSVMRRKRG